MHACIANNWLSNLLNNGMSINMSIPVIVIFSLTVALISIYLLIKTRNLTMYPISILQSLHKNTIRSASVGALKSSSVRIEAEEAKQFDENSFRSTFEHAAVGILHTSMNGNFILINDEFCGIVGYSRDELTNMPFEAITHPSDVGISNHWMKALLDETSKSVSFEKRYIKKDKSVIWVNVTTTLSRNSSGLPQYFIAVVQDITAQRTAKKALKESESRLNSAQAMAHVGNWEIDLSTKILWASEECFAIYGFDYTEQSPFLPLSRVQAAVNESDRQTMDEALNSLIVNNDKYDVEFRLIPDKKGDFRFIHSIARIEKSEDGRPTKVVGVIQDITDKKLAEIEIKKSETKHKAMIENIADVIAIMAPDGHLKYISPNTEKWFGWKPEELIGTNVWLNVHPDDLQSLQAKSANLIEEYSKVDSAEFSILCRDGSYKTIELTAVNMTKDPSINGILMNYHDITERKKEQKEYKTLLQTAMDGFCMVNGKGQFLEVNDSYCILTGYSRELLLEMSITQIEADESGDIYAKHAEKILLAGSDRFETKHRSMDGRILDFEVSCNAVKGVPDIVCAFFRDITERKQREERIIYLSYHDALTGLYNRMYFDDKIRQLDATNQFPVSVIMGDINGLKLTNDVFGHEEGDKLLVEIAGILTQVCRKEDIVARTGGDEFCILLPGSGAKTAHEICERIYRACGEYELALEGTPYNPSISMGFATKTSDTHAIEIVMREAEDSMYKRKLLESKSMHSSLVSSIKATMLEKSHETKEHADRLIQYTTAIGQKLNLGSDQIFELELLSSLHDIGKIGIDDHILCNPQKLTDMEWIEMKRHPEIGYRIALASPELVPIANGILYHHERWDGAGYPQGLKGAKIPLSARILAVADAFDAMINDRPYRKAMPKEDALMEIVNNSGQQFDPEIVKAFLGTVEL